MTINLESFPFFLILMELSNFFFLNLESCMSKTILMEFFFNTDAIVLLE